MDLRLHKFLSSNNCNSLEEYKELIKKDLNEFYFLLPTYDTDFDKLLNTLKHQLKICEKVNALKLAGFQVYTDVKLVQKKSLLKYTNKRFSIVIVNNQFAFQ